jgi:hypothetical protein
LIFYHHERSSPYWTYCIFSLCPRMNIHGTELP